MEVVNETDISPALLYRNLVARNTREPRRIAIAPPPDDVDILLKRSSELESLVALRIVPNYAAPFAPVLFCQDGQIVTCSFGGSSSPITPDQTNILDYYALTRNAVVVPLQLDGEPSACRALLLVKHVLESLSAPTSRRELTQLLQSARAPSSLSLECQTRFDVLDQAWLWANKWARR